MPLVQASDTKPSEEHSEPDDFHADSLSARESAPYPFANFFETSSPVVSFADMDNDGDADIVVTSPQGGESYWIENTLGKDAQSLFDVDVFRNLVPTTMASGDIDGDGTTDVVIGHMTGAKVYFNDGSWTSENIGVSLSNPHTIVIADVNQDGLNDILIRDSREVVLAQNVDGLFGIHTMTWPNLGDTSFLAVADMDITNATMEILTLNGQGILHMISHHGETWLPAKSLSSISMSSFQIADLNSDGRSDIYVEDSAGNKVWLESDGTGGVIYHDEEDLPAVIESQIEPAAGEEITEKTVAESVSSSLSLIEVDFESTSLPSVELEVTPKSTIESSVAGRFFALPVLLDFIPPEPSFDFLALPDVDFEIDLESTVDYSSESRAVVIDLEYGETYTESSWSFGGYSFSWFTFWHMSDQWTDTDTVLNAIGSDFGDDVYGNDGNNVVFSGKGQDWIWGEAGEDTLVGGRGQDMIYGGEDDDLIVGGRDGDLLFGDEGDDVVFGGHGNDHIYGGDGSDTLLGGSGSDFIKAGAGDDVIFGDAGADTLDGGAGNDTFHYVSVSEGGDTIRNFSVSEDTFEFEFGANILHTVTEPYSGDLDVEGEGFVWEGSGHGKGNLYYDSDMSVSGDETLIAHVELDDADATVTIDDISIV
ncbi:MAG: FG-GAP-like repeat-containing protein [Pseudodesulfovibrio sp.]